MFCNMHVMVFDFLDTVRRHVILESRSLSRAQSAVDAGSEAKLTPAKPPHVSVVPPER